jgi:stress-induced morphogen
LTKYFGTILAAVAYLQEVTDESDGCGAKFNFVIVSEQFEGKSLLARQR